MLQYYLYDNHFTPDDPEDCLARPVDVRVRTREDLIEDITGPGSILKPTESNAVIGDYWGKITDYLREGEAYSDGNISVRPGIGGVFLNEDDQFDSTRHKVQFIALLKDSVTHAAADVQLRKVDGRAIVPEIDHVYDWGSELRNEMLTPGDVLEVMGSELKLHDNLEEEEGVFFLSQADDSEVRATQIRTNEPKTLTMRIPDSLTAGTWRLEVRNTTRKGKTLRTGIFPPVLTVE